MLSFDVANLYTNIPVKETLKITEKIITDKLKDQTNIEAIIDLLNICIDQNFCKFNNKIYQFSDGLPMGMALSGLLSDIFLDNLESIIIDEDHDKNILIWRRYVDDVFVVWKGNDVNCIGAFHDLINSLHPNINFTLELESDNNLKFMDLSITKRDNAVEFDIYRKPTQTDVIIPADSYHHHNHINSSINSYLNRCFTTPLSNNNREKEINTIRNIAINNGFTLVAFNKMLNRHIRKFNIQNSKEYLRLLPL